MDNKKKAKISLIKILVTLMCFGMLVLSCFYLKDLPRGILLGAIIVFASLGVIVPSINSVKHESLYKIFLVSAIFAMLILVAYIILDATGIIYKFKDFDALTAFIRSTRQWGILIYIGIVIFAVVVLPIPSAVVALIGTALYGPTYAFLFMTAGTIVGSIITFLLGKIFGKKLVNWMIGEEKTLKYADLLNNKGKFFFILMMLFPFFPDDIICLVAGISTMSFKYFILTISLTRPVMIAFMCYFGSGTIIPFSGWGIPVWIALFVTTVILFFVIGKVKKKIMDKK